MENKSLYDNVNVKGKWIYWPLCEKREQKVQNNVSDKKYLILQSGVCVSNQRSTPYEARNIPLHQRPARRAKVLNRVM